MSNARNQEVIEDVNRGHAPSRRVSIMTPVSDCSDCSNDDDDKGGIVGGKSRSLRMLPTTRSMVVDDGNRLSRSVAIGNDPSKYSADMITRFMNDTTNQFISSERWTNSTTKSTSMSPMLPHSTPKYTLSEYKSQLPRSTSQHLLPSAASTTLPEALLTTSTSLDTIKQFQLPRATGQHQLPSATSYKTLPEALLTNSSRLDILNQSLWPQATRQHRLPSATLTDNQYDHTAEHVQLPRSTGQHLNLATHDTMPKFPELQRAISPDAQKFDQPFDTMLPSASFDINNDLTSSSNYSRTRRTLPTIPACNTSQDINNGFKQVTDDILQRLRRLESEHDETKTNNTARPLYDIDIPQHRSTTGHDGHDDKEDFIYNKQTRSKQHVKISSYNGESSLNTWLAQFQNAARFNQWDDQAQLAHITNCLTGRAADAIFERGDSLPHT